MSDFLLFTAAFFIALFIAWKFSKEKLYSERVVFDSVILTSIFTLLGARITYVFFHLDDFGFNILKWIVAGLYPGLSIGGALLGAGLALWVLSDKKTLVPFPELADLLTKTFFVVVSLLLVGFSIFSPEHGKSWAVSISFFNGAHPVTIYRLLITLFIGGVINLIFNKKRTLASGTYSAVFWLLLIIGYFCIDFFNLHDVYYWKLSVDQWIFSILILILSIVLAFQIKQKTVFQTKK